MRRVEAMKLFRIVTVLMLLSFSLPTFAQLDIVIDGEKDDFYNTLTGPDDGWLWIPAAAGNNNGVPDDDVDLSANLWSAWDEDYFYIYEVVSDDVVLCNNATVYQNDCLEIKLDPDPFSDDEAVWATRLSAFGEENADEPAGVDNLTPEGWLGAEAPTEEDYVRVETDTGYILELRFKWEWLATPNKGPVEPEVENLFGLAFMNHDNDDAGREASIEWATALMDEAWNDPKLHGTVEFLPENKLKYMAENARTGDYYENPEIFIPAGGSAVKDGAITPETFGLSQNFPNPFNPTTKIEFKIGRQTGVKLSVYNLYGQEIITLVDEVKPAGSHVLHFDGSALASGIYFYKLTYDSQIISKKMVVMK